MRQHTIYLAGGLTTNWQLRVIDEVKRDGVVFYNPMILGSRNIGYIAKVESGWIKDSTIMFAYIEADNQRPLCSFSELVLAAKTPRCKNIIVVDEIKSRATAWLKSFLIDISEYDKLVQFTNTFRHGLKFLDSILIEANRNQRIKGGK
jgi:hypothetical protein